MQLSVHQVPRTSSCNLCIHAIVDGAYLQLYIIDVDAPLVAFQQTWMRLRAPGCSVYAHYRYPSDMDAQVRFKPIIGMPQRGVWLTGLLQWHEQSVIDISQHSPSKSGDPQMVQRSCVPSCAPV
eukprot:jgi/Botrbrau1/14506/Bobra.0350s0011.1